MVQTDLDNTDYQTLNIERHADLARGNIVTIRIGRPEAFNAVNETMHCELARVVRAAQHDRADVFVLTGTGRAFCAGGDIDWFQEMIDTCLQFFGGYGYMDEYPISRMYADACVQRIYGGSCGPEQLRASPFVCKFLPVSLCVSTDVSKHTRPIIFTGDDLVFC